MKTRPTCNETTHFVYERLLFARWTLYWRNELFFFFLITITVLYFEKLFSLKSCRRNVIFFFIKQNITSNRLLRVYQRLSVYKRVRQRNVTPGRLKILGNFNALHIKLFSLRVNARDETFKLTYELNQQVFRRFLFSTKWY